MGKRAASSERHNLILGQPKNVGPVTLQILPTQKRDDGGRYDAIAISLSIKSTTLDTYEAAQLSRILADFCESATGVRP